MDRLIQLFDCPEPEERNRLVCLIHRAYAKIVPRRALIKRTLNEAFDQVVYERAAHSGVSDMLSLVSPIISGYAIPLRSEHKTNYERSILKLYTASNYTEFMTQHLNIVMLYINKDSSLSMVTISFLLNHWPRKNSSSESYFLENIFAILEYQNDEQFDTNSAALFKRIAE